MKIVEDRMKLSKSMSVSDSRLDTKTKSTLGGYKQHTYTAKRLDGKRSFAVQAYAKVAVDQIAKALRTSIMWSVGSLLVVDSHPCHFSIDLGIVFQNEKRNAGYAHCGCRKIPPAA